MERTCHRSAPGGGALITRRFLRAVSTARASSVYPGATTTSVNTGASASATSTGTSPLQATMPPKAEVGSPSWARR